MFNDVTITALEQVLDEIETTAMAEEGEPACLVTVSTGGRKFSTGFDLNYWRASPLNVITSFSRILLVYNKMITLPMPSMAILNGHTFAGGLVLALCHDLRIMTNDKRPKWCLSEINLGFPLAEAFLKILELTMSHEAAR